MASTRQKQRSLSQNQSLRICKTSTNAFLSAIAYFRKIFPEDAFRDVEWADNVQFPTLTHTQSKRLSLHKDEDTNASLFAKWITENIYEMSTTKGQNRNPIDTPITQPVSAHITHNNP